jgi:hypothetical protein
LAARGLNIGSGAGWAVPVGTTRVSALIVIPHT